MNHFKRSYASLSPVSLAAALFALAACGGGDDPNGVEETEVSGGAGGPPAGETPDATCMDSNEPVDPTRLIDDMEDQDGLIAAVAERSGGWWTAGDETPGATIFPERSLTMTALPEQIPTARCSSRYAMRVTGQGFQDWGALLGMSFVYGASGQLPYDASGHEGITFWARIGDTSTNQVRVAFSDENSEPLGGVCVDGGPMGARCFDTFGIYLPELDVGWKRFRVPFAGLAQRNFGPPADGVATHALYSLHFAFEPSAIFDFWVDDVSFY